MLAQNKSWQPPPGRPAVSSPAPPRELNLNHTDTINTMARTFGRFLDRHDVKGVQLFCGERPGEDAGGACGARVVPVVLVVRVVPARAPRAAPETTSM